MKTTIKILILLALAALTTSCTKTELPKESQVYLILMTPNTFETKEEGLKARELNAVRAEFDTDKGTYNFNQLEKKGFAYHTETVFMPNGDYRITDIRLYDAQDNMIYQVHHGTPELNSGVTNWIFKGDCKDASCNYTYNIEADRFFSFQVWGL